MIFNNVTFTITDEALVLTMTPIKCYNTTMGNGNKRVYVSYNIVLKVGEEEESTVVHYYLSDGHTNTLRANLFYPFLYFDIKKQIPSTSTAPTRRVLGSISDRFQSDELVVKLQTVRNLNLATVEKGKRFYLRAFVNDTELNPIKDSRNVESVDTRNPKKAKILEYNNDGIFSILTRLNNIVDLVLTVTCPEVVNFNYDSALLDHNYVRYRPQSEETYDMNIYERLPEGELFDQHFRFDDYMRLQKLKELQTLRDQIIRGGSLAITESDLPVNIITYEDFNREIGITYEGIDLPIPSTLSDEFKIRVANYATLSDKLADILFTREVPFILPPSLRENYELIDYLWKGWGIQDAYKKYLKYKMKYLKLKQSMKLS